MYHVLEIYVENPDIAKYANRASIVNRDHYVVFIDIGHGGKDPGASANGIVEKNYNLNIGLKIRDNLKSKGIEVVMNRESDIYVDFKDTASMANAANPDAFVSLHSNAAASTSANGIETFYSKEMDIPLGNEVHNRLISNTGATNRGLKYDTYYVTNRTTMPAILVENGFVTNAAEAARMKEESYQNSIINAITDGIVAYLAKNVELNPGKQLTATRIYGQTRYETSYELFRRGWQAADTAILVTGQDYPDALSAAPLAGKFDAPILLVKNTSLSNQPELKNILIEKGVSKVYIVGGTGIIPSSLEDELSNIGISSKRLGGKNRYNTSVLVANELGSTTGEVAIAYGLGFADGLSISAVAAMKGMPILLTETNSLPSDVSNYIKNNGVNKSYVVGGTGVVSDSVAKQLPNAERLGGSNRYITNANVFNRFESELNNTNIYIASGLDFPDALSSSALATRSHSFVLLSNTNSTEAPIRDILINNRDSINEVCVLGSNRLISDNILYNLGISTIK
nr:cell wall-binding repeat-containing protein [Clostridium sp. NSJ-145]